MTTPSAKAATPPQRGIELLVETSYRMDFSGRDYHLRPYGTMFRKALKTLEEVSLSGGFCYFFT
jgi:hypothetical protein